ncbi:adenosylcobinamide-GDP ribazoletransferase, partial [Pseudomonas aeruginosa]|uniref:adenosylcobinamide-GDP ribazoletransferase n=1 Tax=Pseudomonas aeruginosa TaxID=287 RepID=UPI003967FB05
LARQGVLVAGFEHPLGFQMLFAWLRSRFLARLGGTTGDTAGALVELTECAVLVALAL